MPAASYPNFAGKHGHEAIFSPAEVVASLAANGPLAVPDAVILAYQPFLFDELKGRGVQPTTGYIPPLEVAVAYRRQGVHDRGRGWLRHRGRPPRRRC